MVNIQNCYHCSSKKNNYYAEENGFTLVKCSNCGLLYVNKRPSDDEISEGHKQGKHSGIKELDVTGRFSQKKATNYIKILNELYKNDFKHIKSWLDVGCGHGEFLLAVKEFSQNSIDVLGTEPNIHKQKSAQSRGLNVSYFDLSTHDQKYDAISLLNVYSHIPNPPEFLNLLKGLLNPNGELILETGDIANFSSKDIYRPFHLPDHLSFASQSILVEMLERIGFQILEIKKYPYVQLSLASFTKELVKLFLPRYDSRIKYFFNWKKYSETDIYIRAKLT